MVTWQALHRKYRWVINQKIISLRIDSLNFPIAMAFLNGCLEKIEN